MWINNKIIKLRKYAYNIKSIVLNRKKLTRKWKFIKIKQRTIRKSKKKLSKFTWKRTSRIRNNLK
jgi:hypothetical protein